MTVSVMIATKNRAGDLHRTCRVLGQLNPPPLEVLITADGCTDETVEVARCEVPDARLFINEVSKGSVASRDWMMRKARGELVFALDDDSYPEEADYALQCVAAGYEVLFSPVVTVRHHYSDQVRSEMRNHHRHARNEFWSVLLRCPFPYAPGVALYRALSQFRYACQRGFSWAIREPAWWWQAVAGVPYCLAKRHPVSWTSYKRWLRLPESR